MSSSVDQSAASTSTCGSSAKISAAASASSGVELGGEDPGLLAAYAGAQPGRADAAAGAELGHRAVAGRGQHREQPAGLVAAERHVARPRRETSNARVDDVGQLGWVRSSAGESRICGSAVSDVGTTRRNREARSGGPAVPSIAPCGACSYSSSAAARPDERPPRRGGSALRGFSITALRARRSRRPRDADASLHRVIRQSARLHPSCDPRAGTSSVAGRPRPRPTQYRLHPSIRTRGEQTDVRHVPRVGPGAATTPTTRAATRTPARPCRPRSTCGTTAASVRTTTSLRRMT